LIVDLSRELKQSEEEGLRGSPRQLESQWRGNKRGSPTFLSLHFEEILKRRRNKKPRSNKNISSVLLCFVCVSSLLQQRNKNKKYETGFEESKGNKIKINFKNDS